MSTTYPVWPLTTYPDALDKANANIRQSIINFEDRTSATDPLMYYVLANDVRALQQSVFSIQETLGIIPQSSFDTVDLRISNLEDSTTLDIRYGGVTWRNIPEADRPTIMGHLHSGASNGASKIDLANHTTGKLGKSSLNLTRTDANGLTGSDIALSSSTDVTVAAKFNDKLDKTGGTISGTGSLLTVNAPFNSRMYKEAEAYQCIPTSSTIGDNIADAEAFSGTARRALPTHGAGNVIHYTSQLRYGDYSLGLRMRVSNNVPLQAIGKIKIYSGTVLMAEMDIIPAMFTSTGYQMIYTAFTHKSNWNVNVYVTWYGTSIVPAINCTLVTDSLVITPIHITAFDKE